MDGSLWFKAKPDAPPFVIVGAEIEAGDTIGLLEIMKTFSPLRADVSGTWLGGTLEDGDPVRAGQVVGWLRPN
jgi:acetyl-CoA carboxylase biotin carboxyl carrier protein